MGGTAKRVDALQRSLYESNERRIRQLVSAPRRFAREDLDRYEHELAASVPPGWGPSTPAALRAAIGKARVVLVGDYHTLAQSQRGFLRILRAVRSSRIVVALEFVAARFQRAVDAYMDGRIDDDAFLRRIEYRKSWPSYQVWPSFKPVFEMARRRKARVVALDCMPGECGSVFSRAEFAAWKIAEAAREHPRHKVLVLMGEAHLAPGHLPDALRRALGRLEVEARVLTVHQNLDPLYFALMARGLENEIDVVRLAEDRFVMPASSPIAAQHSFLAAITGEDYAHVPDRGVLRRDFLRTVRDLGRILGIPVRGLMDDVLICGPGDLEPFAERGRDFDDATWLFMASQIGAGESVCLPGKGVVYLANLSPTHVAEEAAHCLKARLAGGPVPLDVNDFLYSRAIHEAIGYFGAKLFNPKRKPPMRALVREAVRQAFDPESEDLSPEVVFAAQVAAWHRQRQGRASFRRDAFDLHLRAMGLPGGLGDLRADVMRPIYHFLGYDLGERLYVAFRSGRMTTAQVRRLFLTDLETPGTAFDQYHRLAMTLRSIRLPARF
jgi:hypothetical protein